MKKKVIAVLLLGAMVLSLTGCGNMKFTECSFCGEKKLCTIKEALFFGEVPYCNDCYKKANE